MSADLRPRLQATGRAGRPLRAVHAGAAEAAATRCGRGCGRCSTASRCPALPTAALVSLAGARPTGRRASPPIRLGRGRAGAAAAGHRRAGRRRTRLIAPAAGRPRCRPAWRPAFRSARRCCRRCCAASASASCRPPALADDQYGPPAPAMLMPLRRRRPRSTGCTGAAKRVRRSVRGTGGATTLGGVR